LVRKHLVDLNELVVFENQSADFNDGLCVNRGIEDRDSESELGSRDGCAEREAEAKNSDENPFFHGYLFS
jgi:hypothetical protein